MLKLTIWMNMPSPYQSDLFRSLTASGEIDLRVIFARGMSADRAQLGWKPDLAGYSSRFLDGQHPVQDALRTAWAERLRFHVVNGVWAEPPFAAALLLLSSLRSRFAIYSEASNPTASRSRRVQLLQWVYGGPILRRSRGVLAISHFASEFYRKIGAAPERIYPFGYFRSLTGERVKRNDTKETGTVEVVFVGQVIHRKGVDLLFQAMIPLLQDQRQLSLAIIGNGDLLPALQEQVERSGVTGQVRFEGAVPAGDVADRVGRADVLVLPSRWDGWGLVVNEAMGVGVPVIVSDRCGASDLVRNGENGYVFRGGDAEHLRSTLSEFLGKKKEWARFRTEAAALGKVISSDAAAAYLLQCLRHMTGSAAERPRTPWHAGTPRLPHPGVSG